MTRKLSTPFAVNSTLINEVPVSQTSDSEASYDIGFPPKNFQPISNGGVAVDGKDFNGVLNDITGNIVDLNKGLPQYFDSAYSTLIGGYPLGSRLCLNDNSGYVVSTIDNNTNDPNTSMTGWVYAVKKYSLSTIADLKSYNDVSAIIVSVERYTATSDPRSGGSFYYDASDTTTAEDGVFVFTSSVLSGRWKRVLNGTEINITQGGLTGVGDESDLLNALLTACETQSTVLNYSRKFTVDGLQMRVNTTKQINLNMTLVNLQNIDIIATLPDQDKYNNTSGCALLVKGSDSWINNPTTYRRRHKEKLLDIEVVNNGSGKNTLGIVLNPNVEGQFANSIFEQVDSIGFDYNLVLASNTYLITFLCCNFDGAKKYHVTTTSYLGIESTMSNMGENIRFAKCTFANSTGGVLYADYGMWITFDACSFDYNGKSTDTLGWFELLGNIGLNILNCHFEAGNDNSQLGNVLFHTNATLSSVSIIGGTMLIGYKCNNNYVFYSDNSLNHNFSIENTWVFGAGLAKKAWSNTGMGRFRIRTNTGVEMQNVNAPIVQTPNKSLTKDYNFTKSNLLQKSIDQWWVTDGGDTSRTSSISSSGVTGSYTTTTDENGNTVPCLKLVVNKTDQQVFLLIKRDKLRNSFNPAFRLRYKSDVNVDGNLYASVKPVDVSQEIDTSKSIYVPTLDTSRWDTSVFGFNVEYKSSSTITEMRYQDCHSRTFDSLNTFDYYLFTFNFTLRANFTLYILSAECYDMDN